MVVTPARRYLFPVLFVVALAATDAAIAYMRRADRQASAAARPSTSDALGFLADPVPLPPFSATDLDGADVSQSRLRGRVGVVNFWATWCWPCRKEIPALVSLQNTYPADLVVIGVLDDRASTNFVRAFGASLGMNYPIVRTTADIEGSFGQVLALPTTYVVDSAGRVVAVHVGEVDSELLTRQVQALLAGSREAVR